MYTFMWSKPAQLTEASGSQKNLAINNREIGKPYYTKAE